MTTAPSSSSPPLHKMSASAAGACPTGPHTQSSQQPQQQQQHARPASVPQTRRPEERDKSRNKRMNQYSFEAQIGKGQHGTVKRAVNNDDGVTYAIKIVSRKPKQKHLPRADTAGSIRAQGNSPLANKISSTENKIRKEIAIMKKCRHHHVVQLFDVIDDPTVKRVFLVMEYMGGGELKWRNKHHEPILSLEQVRRIARDVVLGIEYLHYQGIIHRDIKPANILYSKDRSHVKLADFGSAHFSYAQRLASAGRSAAGLEEPIEEVLLNEADLAKTAGSPAFFAPELCFQGEDNDGTVPNHQLPSRYQITKALDVWALGITLYTLLYGNIPYDVRTEFELYDTIPNHQFIFPDEMTADRIAFALQPRDSFASQAINLLESTLQKDPSKRITIQDVKRHPFIIGDIPVDQREQWLRDTSPARNAIVEVSMEDAQGAIAKIWTAERFRAYWRRKVTTVRPKTSGNTVGSPPSRPSSVTMMDALIGSNHSGTVGRSRSEKSPKRRKRDVAKDLFHGPHGPSGSGTKSAVDLPTNGAPRASRPARPHIITNNTGGSSRSQPPLSSSPPSRSSSPTRTNPPAVRTNGFFNFSLFNRFRRPKSETTMVTAYTPRFQSTPVNRSYSAMDATHSEKQYSHPDYYHQDDQDDHEQPFSPVSQESSTDDEDFGTIADAQHATYIHRDSAGSSLTVSTHSDMADPSARVIGAGGYGIEPQHASPDGVESSSLPSGPSSLRAPPLVQPSPRVAGMSLQIVAPKIDSWDLDSTVPTRPRANVQTQVPPRSGVSSPLGRVAYPPSPSNGTQTQHLDNVFDDDDDDDRPGSHSIQRPRVDSVPLPPGTPSGRRRYGEDDDDDSDNSSASCHSDGNGDDDTEGHGYVQMAPRRPSTSAQNSPSGPSSGAQSPAMSPPRRTLGLGVSVGASQP